MTAVRAGRVNGVHAEPGTVLGPKEVTREFVVVIDNDPRGVTVGYASQDDIDALANREPRSVAEARLIQAWQEREHAQFLSLFRRPQVTR